MPWRDSRVLRRVRAALFTGQYALAGVVLRGATPRGLTPAMAFAMVASVCAWSLVWTLPRRRTARIALSLLAASLLVVDAFVVRYYGTPLDRQLVASALHGWADVRPIVVRLVPRALAGVAAIAAVEYALLGRVGPGVSPRTRSALLGVALLGLLACPADALTPDLSAARVVTLMWAPRQAPPRGSVTVTLLPSSRDRVPTVLLVLTESVRATSYCSDPAAPCAYSPEVNAMFPGRVPLRQMRSLASYTALSVSALLTGMTQEGPRDAIRAAPLLFDYAHAMRVGNQPVAVAYWSAQRESLVDRSVRASVTSLVTLETLLGRAVEDEDEVVDQDIDRKLADRCVTELPTLPRPALVVLHLLGTHAPYFVDPDHAPFQPVGHVVSWAGLPDLQHAYEDSIVAQDRSLARCLSAFVRTLGDDPWLIVFTSDHGEAFGEHGGIHHGQSLYDDQIHVPGWVAASPGAIDTSQAKNLGLHRDAFVTHLDVLPTILDALGVWDALPMAPWRARLRGRSLLAPPSALQPVPITNCTDMFPCPLNTWGMIGNGHSLVGQAWDGAFHCVDLLTGDERAAGPACLSLREASRAYFPRLPGGQPNVVIAP